MDVQYDNTSVSPEHSSPFKVLGGNRFLEMAIEISIYIKGEKVSSSCWSMSMAYGKIRENLQTNIKVLKSDFLCTYYPKFFSAYVSTFA